jgi:hypothetical protein
VPLPDGPQAGLNREAQVQAAYEHARAARTRRAAIDQELRQEKLARQQAEIDALLDDPVFGRQLAPGTRFGHL